MPTIEAALEAAPLFWVEALWFEEVEVLLLLGLDAAPELEGDEDDEPELELPDEPVEADEPVDPDEPEEEPVEAVEPLELRQLESVPARTVTVSL